MKKSTFKILSIFAFLCLSFAVKAQTPGTMTFTFTTPKHTTGNYATDGRYVLAVWIESCATCGTTAGTSTYVRTKLRYWGINTTDHLPTWSGKSGNSTTGATTGATSTVFTSRTVTWDGTAANGTTALADGSYRIVVEETWGHTYAPAVRYFPFTKGAAIYQNTTNVANDGNFTNISLQWVPTALLQTDSVSQKPDAVVYPNPSKGVFNIDFKNAVTNIKVINILGEEVYNQNFEDNNVESSKQVDLSAMTNGVYFINATNDSGTSTYKVVLDK